MISMALALAIRMHGIVPAYLIDGPLQMLSFCQVGGEVPGWNEGNLANGNIGYFVLFFLYM